VGDVVTVDVVILVQALSVLTGKFEPVEPLPVIIAESEDGFDCHAFWVESGAAFVGPVVKHAHPLVGFGTLTRPDAVPGQFEAKPWRQCGWSVLHGPHPSRPTSVENRLFAPVPFALAGPLRRGGRVKGERSSSRNIAQATA
jgi:hypothetical protein